MPERTTLIFGAGYSGRAYGRLIAGRDETVLGTTRSADRTEALRDDGLEPLVFDGATLTSDLADAIRAATDIVISIAPTEAGDPALNAARAALQTAPNLQWIAYLSTVGVYGDHDGAWVDETTDPRPVSKRSIQRLDAEEAWGALARTRGLPLAVLRLSGIYGPGRNAFVSLREGRARRLVKPGQVFNRVHVADIASALSFLADRRAEGTYNVTDNLPAPPQDVVAFAACVMKVDPPPEIDFATATLSPMARSFYGENKRVSNARIKAEGFAFAYPDYRTALTRMWAEDRWRDA